MQKIHIPWWLAAILFIETAPMFFGPLAAYLNPGFLGGVGAEELNQATFIYAARNVAVGLAFLVAWGLRSAPMLFILIFIRLITDIGDLPTLLYFDLVNRTEVATAIFVFLYYIPAVIALGYLWRKMRNPA